MRTELAEAHRRLATRADRTPPAAAWQRAVGAAACLWMVVFAGFLAGRREEPLEARERFAVLLYEPYWMLGGLLFAALAASFQRRTRRPPDQDA